jgi:glucan biosynthesis protein C
MALMTVLPRSHDLDWLRLLAVILLIGYHAAAVFYAGELGRFYVVDAHSSAALGVAVTFVHQWHMPLFFFLAGAASWYSLQRRSAGEYVRERLRRLLVPLLIGILVLVPPQVYLQERQAGRAGRAGGSFLAFYPQFFDGVRPAGHFEWAHLWFLAYLLVISIACLPLLLKLRQGSADTDGPAVPMARQGLAALAALALPLMAVEALLRPHWIGFQNLYDDWANLALYLLYFLYGFLFCQRRALWGAIEQHRGLLWAWAAVAMAVLLSLQISQQVPERAYSGPYMAYQLLRGLNSWCWVLGLLALARRWRHVDHPLLRYGNRLGFSVYLFHQPVIVVTAFLVVPLPLAVAAKFGLISLVSLLGSVGLHHGLMRGRSLWTQRVRGALRVPARGRC